MRAPLVAVTATTRLSDGVSRVYLNEAYVQALRAVGLTPLILPPLDATELPDIVAGVQGVVLTGGEDVDPAEYEASRGAHTEPPHRRRDKMELALVTLARERSIPTLAICRGLQVVNVALGGSLVQDIPTEFETTVTHRAAERDQRVHEVRVEGDSALARAVGARTISVNSSHHQSVGRPGEGVRVTARASDGVIEGAEWKDDGWWMLGVQWHPEDLVRDVEDWDRALFRAFATRVRGPD
ncbi:MAG: gamma-glutamyl-gamma-aminobutyrate hydrolase family protein [Gemmatimonadaceae bacterium]